MPNQEQIKDQEAILCRTAPELHRMMLYVCNQLYDADSFEKPEDRRLIKSFDKVTKKFDMLTINNFSNVFVGGWRLSNRYFAAFDLIAALEEVLDAHPRASTYLRDEIAVRTKELEVWLHSDFEATIESQLRKPIG
jgi:hypothetical protein